jgi:hypothetical protein
MIGLWRLEQRGISIPWPVILDKGGRSGYVGERREFGKLAIILEPSVLLRLLWIIVFPLKGNETLILVYSMLQTKKVEGRGSPPNEGKETEIEEGSSRMWGDRGRAKSFGAADASNWKGMKLSEPSNPQ